MDHPMNKWSNMLNVIRILFWILDVIKAIESIETCFPLLLTLIFVFSYFKENWFNSNWKFFVFCVHFAMCLTVVNVSVEWILEIIDVVPVWFAGMEFVITKFERGKNGKQIQKTDMNEWKIQQKKNHSMVRNSKYFHHSFTTKWINNI